MKTLRLHIARDRGLSTLTFPSLPVRIGRDESNECRLSFTFISRTHAALELDGDRLLLRDAGSRYGTFVGNRRLAPNERLDLASVGYEFRLGEIHVRAQLVDAQNSTERMDVRDGDP